MGIHIFGNYEVVKTWGPAKGFSAQHAELKAMEMALLYAAGERVTIYTDSAYVHGAILRDMASWRKNGFLTAKGEPVAHQELLLSLSAALQLPKELAIVKVPGHSKAHTFVSEGNKSADLAAKAAGGFIPPPIVDPSLLTCLARSPDSVDIVNIVNKDSEFLGGLSSSSVRLDEILEAQQKDKDFFESTELPGIYRGENGVFYGETGMPYLSPSMVLPTLTHLHGPAHVGAKPMLRSAELLFFHPHLSSLCRRYVQQCPTCALYNPQPHSRDGGGVVRVGKYPGEVLQMDFTDMIEPVKGKRYLLTIIDTFTGWVSFYPCRAETADVIVSSMVNDWIPTHGVPEVVHSDNGKQFVSRAVVNICSLLRIRKTFASVYHPKGNSIAERAHRSLKTILAKMLHDRPGLNWLSALPAATLAVRTAVNLRSGFSPFELLYGRALPGRPGPLPPLPEVLQFFQYKPYFEALKAVVCSFLPVEKVLSVKPSDHTSQLPSHVYVRRAVRSSWKSSRFTGPHRVTARSSHAFQVDNKPVWYHWSFSKPCRVQADKSDTAGAAEGGGGGAPGGATAAPTTHLHTHTDAAGHDTNTP